MVWDTVKSCVTVPERVAVVGVSPEGVPETLNVLSLVPVPVAEGLRVGGDGVGDQDQLSNAVHVSVSDMDTGEKLCERVPVGDRDTRREVLWVWVRVTVRVGL